MRVIKGKAIIVERDEFADPARDFDDPTLAENCYAINVRLVDGDEVVDSIGNCYVPDDSDLLAQVEAICGDYFEDYEGLPVVVERGL